MVLNQTQKDLKKRALRMVQTKKLIWPLIDLHSEFESQYWDSYYCCRELKQEGNYLTAHYCNKRWCFECNAIRSAKMINGYKPELEKFWNKQFITLTRPNVTAENLKDEVKSLVKVFTLCIRQLREREGLDIKGLRKIEVTYNWKQNSYHPHLHLIVNSFHSAQSLIREWLFRNQNASKDAQDIREADETSFIELFKYAVKAIAEDDMSIYAKDIIFQSLHKIRIYQPFGIKKYVSEDVTEIVRQAYGMLEPSEYKVWRFNEVEQDWYSLDSKSLINSMSYDDTS